MAHIRIPLRPSAAVGAGTTQPPSERRRYTLTVTVSRPLLLALVGVLLLAAAFQVSRLLGQSDDGGANAAPAPSPQSTPAPRPSQGPASRRRGRPAAESRRPREKRRPARRSRPRKAPSPDSSLPASFARAIARRQVVVLLFSQRGSADDRAAAAAVADVRGTRGVAVFTEPVERLARYGEVTRSIQISQVPATLIVGRDRKARVLEGLVDGQTLRQAVRDAR